MSDKIKKLSQAIRLGATFRPQCKRLFFNNESSCAIGAAMEALNPGCYTPGGGSHELTNLMDRFDLHGDSRLQEVLVRNDRGDTREEIADWLQSIGL